MKLNVEIASAVHVSYATAISQLIAESAQDRGIGRGKRCAKEITKKIKSGHALIAFYGNQLAGFSYIDTWDEESFVVNTGLIVVPKFRSLGIAKKIKTLAIQLAKTKYPKASIFSLTTSLPVMKMNTDLGYEAVTYSELPQDQNFWKGCFSCPNYKNLKEKNNKMCFCTAMLLLGTNKKILHHE